MRKLTVVMVAAMILLAGCSGGGGGAESPTEGTDAPATGTPMGTDDGGDMGTPSDGGEMDTPTDDGEMDTPTDDGDTVDDASQPSNPRALADLGSESQSGGLNATEIDLTLYNGTENLNALSRNDTDANRQLLQISSSSGGTTTLYSTPDYTALRNTTTGEVQYGEPSSGIGFGVGFAYVFIAGAGFSYFEVVEWEAAGTTTVDGESAYVYESDSLNQTAVNQGQSEQSLNLAPEFGDRDVTSVDGELVVGTDGKVHSMTVEIETADGGTFGTDLTLQYGDVTVDQPSWVDESQAP